MRLDSDVERDEVQTLMFRGLGRHGLSANLFLKLPDTPSEAKTWLRNQYDAIKFGDLVGPVQIDQIAFSASGLRKLELNEDTLAQFSYPFLQGMTQKERSRVLADTGDDAPHKWDWGYKGEDTDNAVDCAYLIFIPTGEASPEEDQATIEKICRDIREGLQERGGDVVHSIITTHFQKRRGGEGSTDVFGNSDLPREPFGFVDGVSQPIIKGLRRGNTRSEAPLHHVEAGEFILGYPDNRGTQTLAPTLSAVLDPDNILPDHRPKSENGLAPSANKSPHPERAFAKNGSYLVVRQLTQDVQRFEEFIEEAAQTHKDHQGIPKSYSHAQRKEFLAAKMVGRWKDGISLVKYPYEPGTGWDGQKTARPDNDFLLGKEDSAGLSCPYGSHVRRTNPRDSFAPDEAKHLAIVNRHRILRRGRFYEDEMTGEKGLMFMCLNGDIERQFEFIQQTWCQATQFMGLDNEVDPILGRGLTMGRVTIPTPHGPIFLKGAPDAVTVKGGEYFFMPSRAALAYLCEHGSGR